MPKILSSSALHTHTHTKYTSICTTSVRQSVCCLLPYSYLSDLAKNVYYHLPLDSPQHRVNLFVDILIAVFCRFLFIYTLFTVFTTHTLTHKMPRNLFTTQMTAYGTKKKSSNGSVAAFNAFLSFHLFSLSLSLSFGIIMTYLVARSK